MARDRDHLLDREGDQGCARERLNVQNPAPRGVNILLYGPPGTGKTRVLQGRLADHVRDSTRPEWLYSVGERVSLQRRQKGDEPVRGERLQELRLAQRLLAGHGGSLLLFDEMEDLLADPFPAWGLFGPHSRMAFRNTGSKVWLDRVPSAEERTVMKEATWHWSRSGRCRSGRSH